MSATGASPIYYDFDMLEEMQVTTGGADASQQTGGVGINLVTRFSRVKQDAAIGIVTLALPWSFVALHALWSHRREAHARFLALWLGLSLLPFFFIHVFDRYLIGSLLPLTRWKAGGLVASITVSA